MLKFRLTMIMTLKMIGLDLDIMNVAGERISVVCNEAPYQTMNPRKRIFFYMNIRWAKHS